MIFSTTTEYAIRGMAELAVRAGDGHEVRSVMLDDLVVGTTLPRDFLAKVFQRLVKAGLLNSAKGRGGGFTLARNAGAIKLIDIVTAIDGPELLDRCAVGLERCNDAQPCPQHESYKPVRQRIRQYLTDTTLAELANSLLIKRSYTKTKIKR